MRNTLHLLPHITKAVEIGRTFSQLKSRYSAVLTALDRVKVGLAIALPSGDVIVENEEAQRILSLKGGLKKLGRGAFAAIIPIRLQNLRTPLRLPETPRVAKNIPMKS
jgi:hypothetical protein